jgi:hypothetical protein
MIERKRRNDFVRKREFDMLRKVRREGLSPEQLAALGGSSKLDDSESRPSDSPSARDDGVKAKIDEIEQQMVGEQGFSRPAAAGPCGRPPVPAPPCRRPAEPDDEVHGARGRRRALPPCRRCRSTADRRVADPRGQRCAPGPPRAPAAPPVAPASSAASSAPLRGRSRRAPHARRPSTAASTPAPPAAPAPARPAAVWQLDSVSPTGRGGQRGGARSRPRRAGDRLRQRRLRQRRARRCSSSPARRRARATTPRPGWCCSTSTAPPASSCASRAWRSTTRSSSAGRRRSGSRCRSWWPTPWPRSGRAPGARRRRHRLDLPGRCSTPTPWARCARRPCRLPLPWVFDWSALQTRRRRGRDAAVHAVPRGRRSRWRCAGSAASGCSACCAKPRPPACATPIRRSGCAAGRAAAGQPARPVRRGRHRLLRHLRGVAAVLGAGALPRARQRANAAPRACPVDVISEVSTSFLESS